MVLIFWQRVNRNLQSPLLLRMQDVYTSNEPTIEEIFLDPKAMAKKQQQIKNNCLREARGEHILWMSEYLMWSQISFADLCNRNHLSEARQERCHRREVGRETREEK